MNIDDQFADMTNDQLLSYAADHRALAERARDVIRQRELDDRQRLSDFMREHEDMFIRLLTLGGCTRPREAYERIIDDPENWKLVVYAEKSPVSE